MMGMVKEGQCARRVVGDDSGKKMSKTSQYKENGNGLF